MDDEEFYQMIRENLRRLGVYKDPDGSLWIRRRFRHERIYDLDCFCIWCGAYSDSCGTDCPGTSDEEREIARQILESLPPSGTGDW